MKSLFYSVIEIIRTVRRPSTQTIESFESTEFSLSRRVVFREREFRRGFKRKNLIQLMLSNRKKIGKD